MSLFFLSGFGDLVFIDTTCENGFYAFNTFTMSNRHPVEENKN